MDGLRGVAAIIVVLSHFVLAFQPGFLASSTTRGATGASLAGTPVIMFWNPEFAVGVFFVLSGLVLAASASTTRLTLVALLLRRWIRLAGPILGSTLLIWSAIQCGLLRSDAAASLSGSSWLGEQFAWLHYQPNELWLAVRQSLFDIFARRTHFWNQALWTMPVELIGSSGVYVGVVMLRRVAPWRGALLGVAVTAIVLLRGTPYAQFAAGTALFSLTTLSRVHRPCPGVWGGPLLAGGTILAGGMPWVLDPNAGTPYWPVFVFLSAFFNDPIPAMHGVGAVLSVACVMAWGPARRLFAHAVPVALGRISFMVYLCHIALLCTLSSWIVTVYTPDLGYDAATAIALGALLVVLLPIAAFTTWCCDRPSVRLSRILGLLVDRAMRSLLP